MKANKTMQDFNHIGAKYPMTISTSHYPRWMAIVFWVGVAAVFASVIFGFVNF